MGLVADILNYFIAHPQWIIVIFLIYVFAYALSVMFSSPKPGPNPFRANSVRQTEPLLTDKSRRDKVLKQCKSFICSNVATCYCQLIAICYMSFKDSERFSI